MKKQIFAGMCAIAMLAACTANNDKAASDNAGAAEPQTVADVDMAGKWYIESIVLNDTTCVRPSEEVPGSDQSISFIDGAYSIQTNCNSFSGAYSIKGDSIMLGDGIMTEMACDNMATEDALRSILHKITTVAVENDTIAHLNGSNASEYIVLRKAAE